MVTHLARYWWITAPLVVLIAGVVAFEAWSRWVTAEPLNTPLTLLPAGRIDQIVEVRRDCPHSLELLFSSSTRSHKETMALVGLSPAIDGVKVPIRWSVADATGRVVSSGEVETAGGRSYGARQFHRLAVSGLRFPHGQYRLNAEVLRDVQEMQGVSTRLVLRCYTNFKRSFGWQDELLFFGFLVEWFLFVPVVYLLAVVQFGVVLSALRTSRDHEPP